MAQRKRLTKERKTFDGQYKPEWEGPVEAWTVKTIKKNLWRVAPFLDFDDLYQNAFIIFMDCCERYSHVWKASHFMRLYMTCFRNHLNKESNKRTANAQHAVSNSPLFDSEHSSGTMDVLASERSFFDDAEMALLIDEAPREVKVLLNGISDALKYARDGACRETTISRQHRIVSFFTYRRNDRGQRETTNEYLCRIAGLDPSRYDLLHTLLTWLQGDEPCTA